MTFFKYMLLTVASMLTAVAHATPLDDYMELAVGEFSSKVQSENDARYDHVVWQIVEIWPNDPGGARWLYTESWMAGTERPYMQRITRVLQQDDDTLMLQRFKLPDAEAFVSAWEEPQRFAELSKDDLVPLPGCESTMVRAGIDRFEGGTLGNRCPNSYKGASYAISQSTLTVDGMLNWDRGFTKDGRHVWGPATGGYQFHRQGADVSCTKPVRMLVYGEIHDRKKFFAYAKAIADAGLYPETGGYYEAISPAVEVFEGEPPATRGVVIVRFPCADAARDFWYSDAYEAIKPLREGIANFEVLLLPVPPIAEWVE